VGWLVSDESKRIWNAAYGGASEKELRESKKYFSPSINVSADIRYQKFLTPNTTPKFSVNTGSLLHTSTLERADKQESVQKKP